MSVHLRLLAVAAASALLLGSVAVGTSGVQIPASGAGMAMSTARGIPSGATQLVYLDHTFGLTSSSRPPCTVAENCAYQVTVGAGGTFVATTGAGASVGLTPGTGAASAQYPFGRYSTIDLDAAEAPQLTTPADLSSVITGPHTWFFEGFTTQNTTTLQYMVQQTTGFIMRQAGGSTVCIWENAGASPTAVTRTSSYGLRDAYGTSHCRKTGSGASSTYNSGVGLYQDAAAGWAFDPIDTTTQTAYFGRRPNAGTEYPLRGAFGSLTLYSEAKSDDWIDNATRDVAGTALGGGEYVVGSTVWAAGTNYFYAYDEDGYIVPRRFQTVVDADGIYSYANTKSWWATDQLDADSWTDVGTPTITANVASGVFYRWKGTGEVDRVVDDAAGAFEGLRSASAGTTLGSYTASCIVALGDTGTTTDKLRLTVDTDATGSVACDLDIDSGGCTAETLAGYYRCECSTTVSGSPTYIRAEVLVGNATTDTGSVLVNQCQLDPVGWATVPRVDNGFSGTDLNYLPSGVVSTWFGGDIATGGDVSVVFQLDKTAPDDVYDNNTTPYLLDVSDGAQHALLLYHLKTGSGACTSGHLCAQHYNSGCAAGDYTTESTSPVTLTKKTWYVARFVWTDDGGTALYLDTCGDTATCAATTQIGSGTGKCLTDVTPDKAYLGRRWSNTFPLDGHVKRILVRGPP